MDRITEKAIESWLLDYARNCVDTSDPAWGITVSARFVYSIGDILIIKIGAVGQRLSRLVTLNNELNITHKWNHYDGMSILR